MCILISRSTFLPLLLFAAIVCFACVNIDNIHLKTGEAKPFGGGFYNIVPPDEATANFKPMNEGYREHTELDCACLLLVS